jgi:hypothetical protein
MTGSAPRLKSPDSAEIKSGRGGRRPGAGRPPKPSRPKPQPSEAEEAIFQSLREAVNVLLGTEPAPSLVDIAGALARLLARAKALQREALR